MRSLGLRIPVSNLRGVGESGMLREGGRTRNEGREARGRREGAETGFVFVFRVWGFKFQRNYQEEGYTTVTQAGRVGANEVRRVVF